jgi:DNA-binding MarR family transcriptional regulator
MSMTRLANESWEALLHAQSVMMRHFAAEDMWDEATMREYDVLYTLSKHPDGLRMSDLSGNILLSQPTISRMIDRLHQRGLVTREHVPGDRRGVTVTLTEAGRTARKRIGHAHAKSVAAYMSKSLRPEEMIALQDLCAKITEPK